MRIITILTALMCLAATVDVHQARAEDYQAHMHWVGGANVPGWMGDMATSGDVIYTAGGEGILIHRLVDGVPEFVGEVAGHGVGSRLDAAGALLASFSHGDDLDRAVLRVYDLADPAAPTLRFEQALPAGEPEDVATDGRFVAVTLRGEGVAIYDARRTVARRLRSIHPASNDYWADLSYCGDLLVVMNGHSGTELLDVSDPDHPVVLGTLAGGDAVARQGDLLYFVSYPALTIWDVSDPSEPVILGGLDHRAAHGIQVRDEVAYLAYDYNGGGIYTVDVSDPTAPAFLGEVRVRQGVDHVALIGNHAVAGGHAATWRGRLDAFDVTSPVPTGRLAAWGPYGINPSRLTVRGYVGYVVSLGDSEISMVSLVDPLEPQELAAFTPSGAPKCLAAQPGWVSVSGWMNAVELYNTQAPGHIFLMASVPLPGYAIDHAISDGVLVASVYDQGLVVADVSDPTAPVITWQDLSLGQCHTVVAAGRTFYTVREDDIIAIDCSDPAAPMVRSIAASPGQSADIALLGDRLYCSHFSPDTYSGTLLVFDASASGIAPPLSVLPMATAGRLAAEGDELYMAAHQALWVFDVNGEPRPVGNGILLNAAYDVVVAGETVWLAAGYGGVEIMPRHHPTGHADLLVSGEEKPTPLMAGPLQAYPNPFNPQTTLSFTAEAEATARLQVVDLRGRRVATLHDGALAAGPHRWTWDGRDHTGRRVPAGLYLAHLWTPTRTSTTKLAIVE